MPKKIRELKALLLRAGCKFERAKGSHTKWSHPILPDKLVLSGSDGNDAKPYQENAVNKYLKDISSKT
ncbi:type II toxin-antitoxin system HicA family toxin [Thiorhodovibrio frisius]|uniref:YcfA-like protein n=1 Tax=Thiorhodovibrio frisius TaxID=631362 RepID=H8YY70_9GAMM|nr:type II toxin-antitoxin system HicA family toxin [Thiorhodovibrio frisius]EIC23396.1 YcfA-like protein [Thiorhodovibrio frisius]